MTDTASTSSSGTGAADGSRFTVEDAGSTTDAADLVQDGTTARGDHDDAREGGADPLAALQGADVGHVFDQTNGVVDGLDGDSDGTADSDTASREDRADEDATLDGRGGFVIDRRDQ